MEKKKLITKLDNGGVPASNGWALQNGHGNNTKQHATGLLELGIEWGRLIIGYLINQPHMFATAARFLRPPKFATNEQRKHTQVLWQLAEKQGQFDVLSISSALQCSPMALLEQYPVDYSFDFEGACFCLSDNYKARTESKIAERVLYMLHEGKPVEMVHQWSEQYRRESGAYDEAGQLEGFEILLEWMDNKEAGKGHYGLATKWEATAEYMPLYGNGELIIVGATLGMGKTQYALAEVADWLAKDIPVAVFSLEMENLQVFRRIAGIASDILVNNTYPAGLMPGEIEFIRKKVAWLQTKPLYCFDTLFTLTQICSKAAQLVREKGVKAIIIDYLQLVTLTAASTQITREQQVSTISRTLKLLAKRLKVPLIALSQLSRALDKRRNKRAQLGDLRESGAIGQDADTIIFPFRPGYYNIYQGPDESDWTKRMEIAFAKNRNNDRLGTAILQSTRGNGFADLPRAAEETEDPQQGMFDGI
jgi:replicative DNA helicase